MVEASDIQPSHNAQNFEPNPAYQHQNDRDYTSVENAARVVDTAQNFRPEFVLTKSPTAELGTSIVDASGNVLGGNNRAMALQRVYQSGNPEAAAEYRTALAKAAPQFGIDPADLARFKQPVLVRRTTTTETPEQVANAITDFNKPSAAALKPGEQAVADGRRLSVAAIRTITGSLDDLGEEGTLAGALRGENGKEIVNRLVKDGVITEQEKNGYLDDKEQLTPEIKDRIAKAIVGRLFKTPKEYGRTTPETRAKLERIAPQLLRVEARKGWGITEQTKEALVYLEELRARGGKAIHVNVTEGERPLRALANAGLFDASKIPSLIEQEGPKKGQLTAEGKATAERLFRENQDNEILQAGIGTEANKYSPVVRAIARKLQEGPINAARAFRSYANDEAMSRPGAQTTLYEPPSQKEAFDNAFGVTEPEEAQRSFSSTQVNLPAGLAAKVRAFAEQIPADELADDGRETEPHITVLYGLHTEDPAEVAAVLENAGPIEATIGKVSIFKGKDADVVKLEVTSPDLAKMNAKLSKALDFTNKFPEYTPHVTIAYVKPGEGKKYVGKSVPGLTGETIPFDRVTFSDTNETKTPIALTRSGPSLQAEHDTAVPGFYSQLERTIEAKMPSRAPAAQVLATIENPQNGVKAEEIKWTAIDDWLKEKGANPVTKQEVLEFVRNNATDVGEVIKGTAVGPREWVEQAPHPSGKRSWRSTDGRFEIYEVAARNGEAWKIRDTDHRHRVSLPYQTVQEAQRATELMDHRETKFGTWTTPGGSNYREVLLIVPPKSSARLTDAERFEFEDLGPKLRGATISGPITMAERMRYQELKAKDARARGEDYKSPHWDEKNVVAHIRMDDRTGPLGKRILHIAEIQSDWHQAGRKKGYKGDLQKELTAEEIELQNLNAITWQASSAPASIVNDEAWQRLNTVEQVGSNNLTAAQEARREELQKKVGVSLVEKANRARFGVPAGPFPKSWHELAMKRVLRYAAENAYDAVSWDTGATNADRYDLSHQVDEVRWNERNGDFGAWKDGEVVVTKHDVGPEQLEELIGKDIAQKLIDQTPAKVHPFSRVLRGQELKVSAPGMTGFYDKILPAFVNKYGKKWGVKVTDATLDRPGNEKLIYTGPEYNRHQVQEVANASRRPANDSVSPFTGETLIFPFTRVVVTRVPQCAPMSSACWSPSRGLTLQPPVPS